MSSKIEQLVDERIGLFFQDKYALAIENAITDKTDKKIKEMEKIVNEKVDHLRRESEEKDKNVLIEGKA